jgi:hypothetical protein
MLNDVILKDFELDSNVFNVSVQGGEVVDVAEAESVLTIINVAVVADGKEQWIDATDFFEVVDIEIAEHIFKDLTKVVIPVLVYSIENYSFPNVMNARPGQEINLQGRANVGLPDGNIVEGVVIVVELKPAFFEVVAREFAGNEVEARFALKVFKTAQAKYVPPEINDEVARTTGEAIGITWEGSPFDVEQFKNGMLVELEHGLVDPQTNVTDDDLELTGKIALAHLKERADYYVKLAAMEKSPVEEVKPS